MEMVYDKIYEIMDRHTDAFLIMGGDFNACMVKEEDSINRAKTINECHLTDYIKVNNETCEIVDAYRTCVEKGGYTWGRQQCQSRLDYIFVSRYLSSKIVGIEVDWAFETSDHASVSIEMKFEKINMGPGLTRINTKLLEDPVQLSKVRMEIKSMLEQIPSDWNPHEKLEFLKVAIRTVISANVGNNRNEIKNEISELELILNEMHALKNKLCNIENPVNKQIKIQLIDEAISRTNDDLRILREKQSSDTNFRARAKWFEFGEKSNKYFLNLNKKYCKQKKISKINYENMVYEGEDSVANGITSFYQKLYDKKATTSDQDDIGFYDNCPTLSQQSKDIMEADRKESELLDALRTCKDSAPGSDGLTYGVYRKMWDIVGKFFVEAWRHTCEKSIMPPSHRESIIILLPKEGKDASDIGNWRPITLSNCDAKIITKALTIRMAKVVNEIIDSNQTAYVTT
jgi:hypothetical protein